MRVALVVACVLVAGCGRLGFSLFDGDDDPGTGVDAALDAVPDGGMVMVEGDPCPRYAVAPATIALQGTTFRYRDTLGNRTNMGQIDVTARRRGSPEVLGMVTSDDDGQYELGFPTAGAAVPLTVDYAGTGAFTTHVEYDFLVERSITGGTSAVYSSGDGVLWVGSSMASVYDNFGEDVDPTRSTVVVYLRDCAGTPVSGAAVTIPGAALVRYQRDTDDVSGVVPTSTQAQFGHAVGLNVSPGPVPITVMHPTRGLVEETVNVVAGDHATIVTLHIRDEP